ncbi:MAG: hypothetical protein WBB45_21825 [Cyclobacteriaceae bacterium]
MHTLKLFLSSKVNLLTIIILLVVTLTSFADNREGGAEKAAAAEVQELTEQLAEQFATSTQESLHTYRFVNAEGAVISEITTSEASALTEKPLQKMILKSDKLFSSQGTTYYLVD